MSSIASKQSDAVTLKDVQVQTSGATGSQHQDPAAEKIRQEANKVVKYFQAANQESPTCIPDF